jgi:hypothetical protein
MYIIAIIGIIILLVALYFLFGIILKFLLGWSFLMLSIVTAIVVYFWLGGFLGGIIGIVVFVIGLGGTNEWHSSSVYLNIEGKIEKRFHLND